MITGPSGSGKSALALHLMAFGAQLVADDQTQLFSAQGCLWARCPKAIRGMIEARFVGLLAADVQDQTRVCIAVDMGHTETERLPAMKTISYLGHPIPLLHKVEHAHFPAAVLQYVKGERLA